MGIATKLLLLSWLGLAALARSDSLSLAGPWKVRIDEADRGIEENWFMQPLPGGTEAWLPGSLARSGLGHPFNPETGRYEGLENPPYLKWPSAGYTDAHRRDDLGTLVPSHMTYGPAWFERFLEIPQHWEGRRVRLTLERVKWSSHLWLDGKPVIGCVTDSLHTPHIYEFDSPTAGAHRLTLRIDNRPQAHIGIAGHGYGMETEPLWLGAMGALKLAPLDPLRIERATLTPAPHQRSAQARFELAGKLSLAPGARLTARLIDPADGRELGRTAHTLREVDLTRPLALDLDFTEAAQLWNEFHPKLYTLDWSITRGDHLLHEGSCRVGLRRLAREGNRITLNGAPLFLRGNVDCAIHPDTDTPPTARAWWERVLGTHKAAGFNHVRFHTWCPPEVAFEVADEMGLYFQVETAYWVDDWIAGTAPRPDPIGRSSATDAWVETESRRVIRHYEHHPAFALFCIGNEFGNSESDWDKIASLAARLNAATDHALVSATTARRTVGADEYWVTHHSGKSTRGIGPPHTDWDFAAAVAATGKPLISHETGQRPSWPDYGVLLPKFQGVIQPWNLQRLRARAEQAGCLDHSRRAEAAARFAMLQYKSEHEAVRRTPGLAGYQLLMLHDFTGQGEAHVGLLDCFFDPKPGISLVAIRAWNGPTVPLARFERYTWTTDQTFAAHLEVAHEGPGVLEAVGANWRIATLDGELIAEDELSARDIPDHAITGLGRIQVPLGMLQEPTALRLSLRIGEFENHWNLWAYPPAEERTTILPEGLHLAQRLDETVRNKLAEGGTVVLFTHGQPPPTARKITWASTYWTGAWGWGNGMGLLIDPAHPALRGFPTAAHSDWQWWEIIEGGQTISLPRSIIDRLTPDAIPVESLADFHAPAREACVFSAKVGSGRLLICSLDLVNNLGQRHAARALRASLLHWAASDAFAPATRLDPALVRALLVSPTEH